MKTIFGARIVFAPVASSSSEKAKSEVQEEADIISADGSLAETLTDLANASDLVPELTDAPPLDTAEVSATDTAGTRVDGSGF